MINYLPYMRPSGAPSSGAVPVDGGTDPFGAGYNPRTPRRPSQPGRPANLPSWAYAPGATAAGGLPPAPLDAPTFTQLAQAGRARPAAPGYGAGGNGVEPGIANAAQAPNAPAPLTAPHPLDKRPPARIVPSGATPQAELSAALTGVLAGKGRSDSSIVAGSGAFDPAQNPFARVSSFSASNAPGAAPGAASDPNAAFEQALRGRFDAASGPARFEAPPSPSLAPNPSADINNALSERIRQLIGQPNPYLTSAVQDQFGTLSGRIDDQYNSENQRILEEMTRRGLGASTIYGGRLQDSNVMRRTAKAQVASDLLNQMAQNYAASERSALGMGLDASATLGQQDLARAQLTESLRQGDFNRALQGFQANQAAQEQALQDYLGYGQQSFQNQLQTAQFNQNQQAEIQQLLLQMLGVS